ncbi:hypothetical protein RND81_07G113200 [Saponaria officinalis]|uniref:Uncharacterized protein n=1 Tax=Saponaria officinalis TaxID=3572 RepID=A0AAW1JQ53_SAPOF
MLRVQKNESHTHRAPNNSGGIIKTKPEYCEIRTHARMASKFGCLCSPTNHPGSFRCHFHRNFNSNSNSKVVKITPTAAKANTLRMLLLQMIIAPSIPDHRRRHNFQPKLSRFCLMNSQANHGIPV